jgi:hypothetical protein
MSIEGARVDCLEGGVFGFLICFFFLFWVTVVGGCGWRWVAVAGW